MDFSPGHYQIEVEGKDTSSGVRTFYNVTDLTYDKKALSVFVELGRPVYKQGQTGIMEPRHEKTCLCHMRITKAQISLRIGAV